MNLSLEIMFLKRIYLEKRLRLLKLGIQRMVVLPEACRGFWEWHPEKRLRLLNYFFKV